jgi:hypothetical protein
VAAPPGRVRSRRPAGERSWGRNGAEAGTVATQPPAPGSGHTGLTQPASPTLPRRTVGRSPRQWKHGA